jgi:hypothetical protein
MKISEILLEDDYVDEPVVMVKNNIEKFVNELILNGMTGNELKAELEKNKAAITRAISSNINAKPEYMSVLNRINRRLLRFNASIDWMNADSVHNVLGPKIYKRLENILVEYPSGRFISALAEYM